MRRPSDVHKFTAKESATRRRPGRAGIECLAAMTREERSKKGRPGPGSFSIWLQLVHYMKLWMKVESGHIKHWSTTDKLWWIICKNVIPNEMNNEMVCHENSAWQYKSPLPCPSLQYVLQSIVGDSPKSSPNFLTQSSPSYPQSIPQSNPAFPGIFSPIQVHNQVRQIMVALSTIYFKWHL